MMRDSEFNPLYTTPYYGFRRTYYIDELFDENTPPPIWTSQTYSYHDTTNFQTETLLYLENVNELKETISSIDNYEIEIDIKSETGENRIFLLWGTIAHQYYFAIYPDQTWAVGAIGDYNMPFLKGELEQTTLSDFNKMTIRQMDGIVQYFLNENFIFHVDALPVPMQRIKIDAPDAYLVRFVDVKEIN